MATDPKHVRYRTTVCRTHFVPENTSLSDLFINGTQSLNPTLWKCMALETRTPNDTQKEATIHPSMAGCPSPMETTEQFRKPHPFSAHDPTALKHHPRTRTTPLPQRRLLTSASYPKTSMYGEFSSDPRARFDHTNASHTRPVFHGDLRPMLPSKHRAWGSWGHEVKGVGEEGVR